MVEWVWNNIEMMCWVCRVGRPITSKEDDRRYDTISLLIKFLCAFRHIKRTEIVGLSDIEEGMKITKV
jgi:hypothetical protein